VPAVLILAHVVPVPVPELEHILISPPQRSAMWSIRAIGVWRRSRLERNRVGVRRPNDRADLDGL
jgi:hypothetical protein